MRLNEEFIDNVEDVTIKDDVIDVKTERHYREFPFWLRIFVDTDEPDRKVAQIVKTIKINRLIDELSKPTVEVIDKTLGLSIGFTHKMTSFRQLYMFLTGLFARMTSSSLDNLNDMISIIHKLESQDEPKIRTVVRYTAEMNELLYELFNNRIIYKDPNYLNSTIRELILLSYAAEFFNDMSYDDFVHQMEKFFQIKALFSKGVIKNAPGAPELIVKNISYD